MDRPLPGMPWTAEQIAEREKEEGQITCTKKGGTKITISDTPENRAFARAQGWKTPAAKAPAEGEAA